MIAKLIEQPIGFFSSEQDAQAAINHLTNSGFNSNQVSLVTKDEKFQKETQNHITGAKAGAITGIATGFFSGGLLGALSVLTMSDVTPVSDVGIIFSNALRGIVIGVTGCSLIGALIGWRLTKKQDQLYNQGVAQENHYLIVFKGASEELKKAQTLLNNWDKPA
ncbi:conserved hypothetical protein [Gloeothece citriformis PCC 7424]|uniref:General stress protein 17M-like domain-containing protein n=1 Tax=Gloeothece citriformis (strain PCC 7424) TaxID=65393 RepID=B7KCT5_GLOC7|nr:general stress protein [Gloeothece citriformis]ACK71636.1 conserved hypothetical protein [Gloeothece citriformis PCC 7424]